MSTQDRQSEEIRALERLLEVYGADRTRWPARERLRFVSLIAENPEAQRLVAETAALDRLLDQVATGNEERERALSERIMAAARVQQHEPDRVREPASAASKIVKLPTWAKRPQIYGALSGNEWPAAGLLAASLVIGVMLGSAGTLDSTMQEVAEVAGLSSNISVDTQFALGDDTPAWGGEELL